MNGVSVVWLIAHFISGLAVVFPSWAGSTKEWESSLSLIYRCWSPLLADLPHWYSNPRDQALGVLLNCKGDFEVAIERLDSCSSVRYYILTLDSTWTLVPVYNSLSSFLYALPR